MPLAKQHSVLVTGAGGFIGANLVRHLVKKVKPSFVYHLATHGGYHKQQDGRRIVHTNIMGSFNLFDALKTCRTLKRIVNAGSSSEYGSKSHPMKEQDVLEPTTAYGVAKAAQTLLAQYLAREEALPLVTLRFFSVYGPFEEPGRLIADVMCAVVRKRKLQLSSPDPKRDFVFVDDVVEALEWKPRHSLADGLRKTYEWFRENIQLYEKAE